MPDYIDRNAVYHAISVDGALNDEEKNLFQRNRQEDSTRRR